MKKWNDILESAQEFVNFLGKDKFFDQPFNNTMNALIVTDAKLGFKYANQDNADQIFPAWLPLSRGEDSFPDGFEFFDCVRYGLEKNNDFNLEEKDFSGINELWDNNITDMMMGDMEYILNCYANDYFPPLWEQILTAYLNNGLPCGWSDFPPNGKLVVYSNELLEL